MAPEIPMRLQVLNRFHAVLSVIQAGADYFYTPHKVEKAHISLEKAKYGPVYWITQEGGEPLEDHSDLYYEEEFRIAVQGAIHDRKDPVSVLEKVLRDIRYAIDTDSRSGAAGSLGVLCLLVNIAESLSEDFEDFKVFEQMFSVRIAGNYSTL